VTKALSKVGGFLALLQGGLLLKIFHAKRFFRSIEKNLLNKEGQDNDGTIQKGNFASINSDQIATE
jgi:hypothetical protein